MFKLYSILNFPCRDRHNMTLLTLKPLNMVQNIILFTMCKYCCKSMKGFGTTTWTRRAMNHRLPVTSTGCRFKPIGRRFAAALLPRLFRKNPRSHHKGATGRVQTGDQLLPFLCPCQLGQDIPTKVQVQSRGQLHEALDRV